MYSSDIIYSALSSQIFKYFIKKRLFKVTKIHFLLCQGFFDK